MRETVTHLPAADTNHTGTRTTERSPHWSCSHTARHKTTRCRHLVVIWRTRDTTYINLGIAQFNVTTATVGVIVTLDYGLFGAGALPGGIVVDRIGSSRLITRCLLGMGGSFVLLALSPNLVVVALALLVWGAAASVYHPAGLRSSAPASNNVGPAGLSRRRRQPRNRPRPARRRSSPAGRRVADRRARPWRSGVARRCRCLTGEFRRDGGGDGRD